MSFWGARTGVYIDILGVCIYGHVSIFLDRERKRQGVRRGRTNKNSSKAHEVPNPVLQISPLAADQLLGCMARTSGFS